MLNTKTKIIYAAHLAIYFFLTYAIIYFLHIKFFHINVLFYSSLFDVFISVIIVSLIFFYKNKFSAINLFEKYLILIIFALSGYIISMSVPALIDRSLSFYLLEKIYQSGQGISINKIDDLFIKDFVVKYDMINVRLTEQNESGTISINDGCAVITEKGKLLANFSKFFRSNLLPKYRGSVHQFNDNKNMQNFNLSNEELESYKCTH